MCETVITPEIAETLARRQANDNEDLHHMPGNINELKRFLISLNGSDQEPVEILGLLGDVQYIEDYLKGLIFNSKANNNNNNNTAGNESQPQTNATPENFSLDKMSNIDIINRCGALRYSLTQIVALPRPG